MRLPACESCIEEPLRSKLSKLTVFLDGINIPSAALVEAAGRLARDLGAFQGGRVALLASRADQILVALAAAEAAGCEALLTRLPALPPAFAELWKVAAVIGADLQARGTGLVLPSESSFHVSVATSGTTGEPKLARHTIQALLGRIRQPAANHLRPRWLFTYDPATFGGLQVLLTALVSGAEILTLTRPTAAALAAQALQFNPTHISGTPTFWRAFLQVLGDRATSLSLEQITLGGEIADQAILDRLKRAFPGAAVSHIYASTEAGALFAVRDGLAGFPASWLETGIDGVQLRISDGILHVQSPRAMLAYLNAESPGERPQDPWLITGDLVERTGDRVLFRGRQDLVINVGGMKVRPEEVEQALLALPEVAEARVYGISNPVTGMLVAAEIVPAGPDGEDLARHSILLQLRARMAPHKVPRILKFVASISVSAAGKKGRIQP